MQPQDTIPRRNRYTVPRNCERCGQPFLAEPYQVKTGHGRFCSHICAARSSIPRGDKSPHWKGGPVSCTCPVCGKTFYVTPAKTHYKAELHCSRECRDANYARRHTRTLGERFWEKVDKDSSPHGCWLWTASVTCNGYGKIGSGGKYGKTLHAHCVSWKLHNGPVPPNLCVLHNCPGGDNRLCVNPAHLWLGTIADNQADMADKGRSAHGERCSWATLTAEQVHTIRHLYDTSDKRWGTQAAIARQFKIHRSHVYAIVHRHAWAHLG